MKIVHFLDDINQPLSCKQWGDAGTAGIPPIIDDGLPENTVFNWFVNPNATGIYPLIVFINHELVIDRIMGTSPSPTMANLLIENMLNNCSEGFDCNGNCGGIVTLDECGVCGGSGAIFECGCTSVTEGACDCNGNIPDCAGICGGTDVPAFECSEGGLACNENACLNLAKPTDRILINNFNLTRLYPNPFNPILNIDFEINQAGWVKVNITDITGAIVNTVYDGYMTVGKHQRSWNSENLPSGVYLVSLQAGENSLTKKVVLLK